MTQQQYETPTAEAAKLTQLDVMRISQSIAERVMDMLLEHGVMMNPAQVEEYKKLKAMTEERFLKGVEVARMLNCSPAQVTKLRKQGKIKAYVQGVNPVYKLSEVLKIRSRKTMFQY